VNGRQRQLLTTNGKSVRYPRIRLPQIIVYNNINNNIAVAELIVVTSVPTIDHEFKETCLEIYISKIFISEILRGNKSVRSDCGRRRRNSCLRYSQNGNVGVTTMILSDGQFIIIWLSRPYPAQIEILFAFIYVFFRESECYML